MPCRNGRADNEYLQLPRAVSKLRTGLADMEVEDLIEE